MSLQKKTLDQWLDEVDYSALNNYSPSEFSLKYLNFLKLVNGGKGEANKTPLFHLFMLDKLASPEKYVVNLMFRGSGKTSIFAEYLFLYLALFRKLPHLGEVDFAIFVGDSMENGAKNLRKNIEHRYENSEFLNQYLPEVKFTDSMIEFTNLDKEKFSVKLFGATTGLRGVKMYGKRPNLAIMDDLISEEVSTSKTLMDFIKRTVYAGITYAMDPNNFKIIFNGTPFNKDDVIVSAVESGQWNVNVFPVCEYFPCDKKDFKGAWEDRFPYEVIKQKYDMAVGTGSPQSFYQEMMLRISIAEEKLVQDSEIRWYSRKELLGLKSNFNWYITTDFATSAKEKADWSVISVWAYNNNGDWFWVDGICEKQTMDKNIDSLFRLVQEYSPISVGIEITGQQGAFIQWLQKEMMTRNIWFNFAGSGKTNTPGIRPVADKLVRFNLMVPLFKAGKMYFPEEMKSSRIMGEFMNEISLATRNGIKGHDDCLDTISQLAFMNPWKPGIAAEPVKRTESKYFAFDESIYSPVETSGLSNYIV